MAYPSKAYTEKQVLDAIKGSNSIISNVARILKCDWNTAREYCDKWESTKKALQSEREFTLDVAENTIFSNLKDPKTAKWYLGMQGKLRGYVPTQENIIKNADPLNINISGDGMNAEQIAEQDNVEISE